MNESRDAYARLPFRSDRMLRAQGTGGMLAFLDVADKAANIETIAGHLREVPLDILGRAEWILARWGPESQGWPPAQDAADKFQELLGNIGSNAQMGVVTFQVASTPSIVWSSPTPGSRGHDGVLLARARAVEVKSFLSWGQALWLPDSYHYVLPSGKHTASFIRLADAFQDVRAAAALSTWLYQALDGDTPTTVVMDIGTLMPLVSELHMASERHRNATDNSSAGVGTVIALDRYPANALGLQRSLLGNSPDSPMLGLVSVSDSGGFAERLLNAFSALGAPSIRIEQLISRQHVGATSIPSDNERTPTIEDPWLGLNESELAEPDVDGCSLCEDPDKARLVRINPRGMSAMILPEPDLVVPDIFEARRNATIWETYGATTGEEGAISLFGPLETRPTPLTTRAKEQVVFFEPARLLTTVSNDLIASRLSEFNEFPMRSRSDKTRSMVQQAKNLVADHGSIVIYHEQERNLLSGDNKWQNLCEALVQSDFVTRQAEWVGFTEDNGLNLSANLSVDDTPDVLVLALGARTGLSCQRMFLSGRQEWPNANFRGLVIHAHPEDERIWTSIRNTFSDADGNKRILALWLTYFPGWSPLVVERDTYLAAKQRGLDTPEIANRLDEICDGLLPDYTLLGRAYPRLQPHSYFGQELGARETLCAVGAAMQSARIQARPQGAPYWIQFDLRRVLRSYFDGLIHASVLRWCEPQEAWWGSDSRKCCDFLLELESVDFDFDLLLPELLLAGAQEKLPEEATAQAVETAKKRLKANPDERTRSHLKLGIDLCKLALTSDD